MFARGRSGRSVMGEAILGGRCCGDERLEEGMVLEEMGLTSD